MARSRTAARPPPPSRRAAPAPAPSSSSPSSASSEEEEEELDAADVLAQLVRDAEAALTRGVGLDGELLTTPLERARAAVSIAVPIGGMLGDVQRMRGIIARATALIFHDGEASAASAPTATASAPTATVPTPTATVPAPAAGSTSAAPTTASTEPMPASGSAEPTPASIPTSDHSSASISVPVPIPMTVTAPTPATERIWFLAGCAWAYSQAGANDDAHAVLVRARALADAIGNAALSGRLLARLGELDEDANMIARGLAQQQAALGPAHAELAPTLLALAIALGRANARATPDSDGHADRRCMLLLERALHCAECGTDMDAKVHEAKAAAALGAWHAHKGDMATALPFLQRAVAGLEATVGFDESETLRAATNLAVALAATDLSAAIALFERVVAAYSTTFGPTDLGIAMPLTNLADLYLRRGDLAQCEAALKRACAIALAARNDGDDGDGGAAAAQGKLAHALIGLGKLHTARREDTAARDALEAALEIEEDLHGPGHPSVVGPLCALATAVDALGDPARARAHLERAVAIAERVHGPASPEVASLLTNLAISCVRCTEPVRAVALLQRALAIETAVHGPNHAKVAQTLVALAEVQRASGTMDVARATFERAIAVYDGLATALALTEADRTRHWRALLTLGRLTPEPDAARRHLHRALQLCPAERRASTAKILMELAQLDVHAARWEAALPVLQQALALTASSADEEEDEEEGGVLAVKAAILQLLRDHAVAQGDTARVTALQAQLFDVDAALRRTEAQAAVAAGDVPLQLGDPDAARRQQRPDSMRHLTDAQMAALLEEARAQFESRPDDPEALVALGAMHMNAVGGVARDPARAMQLYERAAALGSPQAMFDLAIMLHHGENGGLVDLGRATALYEAAAARGVTSAMHNLAVLLLADGDGDDDGDDDDDDGGNSRRERAVALLKNASDQGHALASLVLGETLAEMAHTDVREVKACFERAAARGVAEAAFKLGQLCSAPGTTVYDLEAAFRHFEAAAAAGHLEARRLVATCRITGRGVEKDRVRGVAELEALAGEGQALAAVQLALLARDGTPPSLERETHWFQVALALAPDNPMVMAGLAHCYECGPAAADTAMARELYERAAAHDDPHSILRMATAHEFGELGLERSAPAAAELAEKAAALNYAPAVNMLARYYAEGAVGPVNKRKADELFARAKRLRAGEGEGEGSSDEGAGDEGGGDEGNGDEGNGDEGSGDDESGDEESVDEEAVEQVAARYRAEADAGDSKAMYQLGLCYEGGLGVEQDVAAAAQWFTRAAQAGSTDGMFALGVCCYNGRGVVESKPQAVAWFRRAAEDGAHARAMGLLGQCYLRGQGVPVDNAEAVRWLRRAADLDDIGGISKLAGCYLEGVGVSKSPPTAVALMEHGVDVAPADRESTEVLARAYIANTQYVDAAQLLQRYLTLATPEDHIACKLGMLYEHGLGVPEDPARAVELYGRAASVCDGAVLGLAQCHELGYGVAAADLGEATRLYREAAALGSAVAKARCTEFGWANAPADPADAVAQYAAIVAKDDDDTARYFLGRRYELGWDGVAPDLEAARRCYADAAANGNRHAREALRQMNGRAALR